MLSKAIHLVILLGATTLAWFLQFHYMEEEWQKLFYTLVAITISYLIFKLVLEGAVSGRIADSRARYSFRKTTQLLFLVTAFVVVLRIWVVNPQALLVAYGLVAAGVAIALQDVFKNFAGALAIIFTGIYRVGDRVEINGKSGDVIDIGLFYTSLLEMRAWVDGDQTTGRIVTIPNGQILSYPVHNYTKDHHFIWEELTLPITYQSDWKKAMEVIARVIKEEAGADTKRAEREISKLEEKYYLSKRNIEPAIFVTPTDNWIMLRMRYVVDARERRIVQNRLWQRIMEELKDTPEVTIASQTLTITTPKLG